MTSSSTSKLSATDSMISSSPSFAHRPFERPFARVRWPSDDAERPRIPQPIVVLDLDRGHYFTPPPCCCASAISARTSPWHACGAPAGQALAAQPEAAPARPAREQVRAVLLDHLVARSVPADHERIRPYRCLEMSEAVRPPGMYTSHPHGSFTRTTVVIHSLPPAAPRGAPSLHRRASCAHAWTAN